MDSRQTLEEMTRPVLEHPCLMDDVPFTIAIRRSTALAQLIIRTVLSQDDLVIMDVHAQANIPSNGTHGVVFDALCIDSCGNMYDVEVQKGHFRDLPKRAAFYEAMLTVHSLKAGTPGYGGIPERCVIFICDDDVEGEGRGVYDYAMRRDDGKKLGDGGRIVFVNRAYRNDDEAIGRLMADMGQKDPQRAFNEEVRESLTRLAGQEGRREMSEEMERIYNMVYSEGMTAGRAEGEKIGEARGKDEGKTEIAARMLKCGRYTLEEILEMTGLTAEQVGEAAAAYETR